MTLKNIVVFIVFFYLINFAHAFDPLPGEKSGVYIWADQLNVSTKLDARFIAEHFIGSQKLTKQKIDAIRKFNKNFIVLQYNKAYGVDIGLNIVEPEQWRSDILSMKSFIKAHPEYGEEEEYFIHWGNKVDLFHRVEHYWSNNMEFHLANPSHKGFQVYMASETLRRIKDIGFNGTFFDVAYFPMYGYNPTNWFTHSPFNWEAPSNATGNKWNKLIIPYWRYIQKKYHTNNHKNLTIVNCGRMVTGWYTPAYLDYVDGGLSEGWMTQWDAKNKKLTGNDWKISASRVLRFLTGNQKILIAQPNADPAEDSQMRMWWIANFLLLKNSRSFYYYDQGPELKWWPEYEINIGVPMSKPPSKLVGLKVAGNESLYIRSYTNGLVLLNAGKKTQKYKLSQAYNNLEFSGGGWVKNGKKPPLNILNSTLEQEMISIKPESALILVRKDVQSPQ